MAGDKGVVSVCATCKHAQWKLTANGRRHPDGSGTCVFQFPDGQLPKWIKEHVAGSREYHVSLQALLNQKLRGRWLDRRDYHRTEPEPCATWEAK